MTAEIAILNKTAVALAADSAVTLSAGTDQQKIFDSADKLFELTSNDAIGIMINDDMNFMEAPLPVLIKKYRISAPSFKKVVDAADNFLSYLDNFGKESPQRIHDQSLLSEALPILETIDTRARAKWEERVFDQDRNLRDELLQSEETAADIVAKIAAEVIDEQIAVFERIIDRLTDASFVGDGGFELDPRERALIRHAAEDALPTATDAQRERATDAAVAALQKQGIGGRATGVIVAGFGSEELFPTLVSYQIYGMVGGRLKFAQTNYVDIDRDGDRARVIPFAQREMVERFLYGLDRQIQNQVTEFCKASVPTISETLIGSLEMPDEDRAALTAEARKTEAAFFKGLADNSFDAIRQQSRSEIEDMVEFMPKPEMARMAEALVNLTSIKRRVSRGFETVGGPIDCAVISQAEGFVWVKRKHYFPGELNSRYFDRMRRSNGNKEGDDA